MHQAVADGVDVSQLCIECWVKRCAKAEEAQQALESEPSGLKQGSEYSFSGPQAGAGRGPKRMCGETVL